ncbi:hypothetical protein BT63DRAFT_125127 [Microthyrium microscopicum]|uniref:Putative gamma-glutamylcyclotransferase n=1 Tax=Microthyrium microscopicum TaxID=703497 RepID=A0A6A6TUB0_9PEZI|nr:hypothetical protein BT63DRAFT_125127 [Microthyrium microscopicum]
MAASTQTSYPDTHTAFFYGTLMARSVLHRVIFGPSASDPNSTTLHNLSFAPAILPNYQRHKVIGADYPAILEAQQSTVRGTLVRGLTQGDIWRLDLFEGDEYERRKVSVRELKPSHKTDLPSLDGDEVLGEVEAETYVWIMGENTLESREWDFDEFVREKMWRWVDGEPHAEEMFGELDEAVKQADPTRGRGMNGDITKALQDAKSAS